MYLLQNIQIKESIYQSSQYSLPNSMLNYKTNRPYSIIHLDTVYSK
jgi:hypothetical protein